MADLAVLPDNGRAFDHHAGLDHCAFADENAVADAGARETFGRILPRRPGEITLDFLESLPGVGAALEDRGVVGLRQVKQIGGFEHGGNLKETPLPAKANAVVCGAASLQDRPPKAS